MTETVRVDSEKCWSVLKETLLRNTPESGTFQTPVRGLLFHRHTGNEEPKPRFYQPVIIVVAQGKKWVKIDAEEYQYGENAYFVTGVDMPAASCVMEASKERPYLSFSLSLDTGLLASLAAKAPSPSNSGALSRGAAVHAVEPDLLDAFLRLTELAEKPEQVPVMAELLLREIHYRLLAGPFGGILRTLNTFGSQGNQIVRAISWLKDNYKAPLRVEDLAGRMNMATSTFHKYFKDITTLSPLQYQKRLRLDEARRLMLSEGHDVTRAAFAVGYESATQFIREYKRLFGESPRKDVVRMRSLATEGPHYARA